MSKTKVRLRKPKEPHAHTFWYTTQYHCHLLHYSANQSTEKCLTSKNMCCVHGGGQAYKNIKKDQISPFIKLSLED